MANRTTVKANIVTKNVPTVTNAILTDILNAEMADNLKFREDVTASQSSAVSPVTVDFTGKDRIDLTRPGGSLLITVAGMADGDEKFLSVIKTAGETIAFVGVTIINPMATYLNSLASIVFRITRKGTLYFADALVDSVLPATGAEVVAGTVVDKVVTPLVLASKGASDAETLTGTLTTKFITPANLQAKDGALITKILNFSAWNMDTTSSKVIPHGLAAGLWDQVTEIKAIIQNNAVNAAHSLEGVGIGGELGGMIIIDSVNVTLYRTTGGRFDGATFNAAGGFVTLRYALT